MLHGIVRVQRCASLRTNLNHTSPFHLHSGTVGYDSVVNIKGNISALP